MNSQSFLPSSEYSYNAASIVIFDQNKKFLDYLHRTFGDKYRLSLHLDPATFLAKLSSQRKADLIVFAWEGAERSKEFLLNLRLSWPDVPVVILTCVPDTQDYKVFAELNVNCVIVKPFAHDELESAFARLVPSADSDPMDVPEVHLDQGHSFIRSSPRMRQIESQAAMVARSDIPVLILGESGTGKEILALFTHKMSLRSNRMFLKINCAAMPADLLESELFGYEQGAFTGATKMKPGKFEICDRGTIFLDEIGEMPAGLQAKLLQVLQDGTFCRLGGRTTLRAEVRIIAATNIDMKKAMAEKTFREDLYYRLNGISLKLPPLRERLDEIPAFAHYFVRKGAKRYGLEPLPISTQMLAALSRYSWPGNLREMENVINRYLVLRDEAPILADLALTPRPTTADVRNSNMVKEASTSGLKKVVRGVKGEAEKAVIVSALEEEGWNRKAAADTLQISYKALLYKIKEYNLMPSSTWAETA